MRTQQALRRAALRDDEKDKLMKADCLCSGGQQQRLCITRCLSPAKLEVLPKDEPCSALDPIATRKVEELTTELRRTLRLPNVTHNLQQAQRMADYTGFPLRPYFARRTDRVPG